MFEKRMYGEIQCSKCNEFTGAKNILEFDKKGLPSSFFQKEIRCLKCGHLYDPIKANYRSPKPTYLHEFLYPVMQAYDSVAMDVDMEVGGNDQTFNMLAGRDLMKQLKNKEKFVLTAKLLVDPTGKKMGKSEGNMITLDDSSEEMYGKVMSWPDTLMPLGYEICTRIPMDAVKKILSGDPRDAKMRLAREIVSIYHSKKDAKKSEKNFVSLFQKHEAPEDAPEFDLAGKTIVEALVLSGLVKSNGEARRNIEQKGVKINEQTVPGIDVKVKSGDIIQKGKRFFMKIK